MYDVEFSRCFEKPIELVKFFRALLGFWDSMTTALRVVEDREFYVSSEARVTDCLFTVLDSSLPFC